MQETQKFKILIAEDDALSRCILEAFLSKRGYEVISATNGEEAFKLLSLEGAPRLAILDWTLPLMGGNSGLSTASRASCRPALRVRPSSDGAQREGRSAQRT
jgi:CheY-like chemotaxis protein